MNQYRAIISAVVEREVYNYKVEQGISFIISISRKGTLFWYAMQVAWRASKVDFIRQYLELLRLDRVTSRMMAQIPKDKVVNVLEIKALHPKLLLGADMKTNTFSLSMTKFWDLFRREGMC